MTRLEATAVADEAAIEEEVVAVFLLAGDADNKEGQRVPARKRKWGSSVVVGAVEMQQETEGSSRRQQWRGRLGNCCERGSEKGGGISKAEGMKERTAARPTVGGGGRLWGGGVRGQRRQRRCGLCL
ncbi:hypothetical protein BHE74_00021322 [Ensete ventricosum]|nr:hypothetical protein BHE74_00021322 [Ensete ventricosum]